MSPKDDLTGKRFGKLTVVSRVVELNQLYFAMKWKCKCDCGNETTATTLELQAATATSCGCTAADEVTFDLANVNRGNIEKTNVLALQGALDDIVETANHFRCIDHIIELANYRLSESFIKQLHFILKTGTSDSRKAWFAVGDYKRYENEVGGKETTKPENVGKEINQLLKNYNKKKNKQFSKNYHISHLD